MEIDIFLDSLSRDEEKFLLSKLVALIKIQDEDELLKFLKEIVLRRDG
jgi:hypothetical protein